jgi:hypothetical protein
MIDRDRAREACRKAGCGETGHAQKLVVSLHRATYCSMINQLNLLFPTSYFVELKWHVYRFLLDRTGKFRGRRQDHSPRGKRGNHDLSFRLFLPRSG